jgi:hypothetical protein
VLLGLNERGRLAMLLAKLLARQSSVKNDDAQAGLM